MSFTVAAKKDQAVLGGDTQVWPGNSVLSSRRNVSMWSLATDALGRTIQVEKLAATACFPDDQARLSRRLAVDQDLCWADSGRLGKLAQADGNALDRGGASRPARTYPRLRRARSMRPDRRHRGTIGEAGR